MYRACIFVRNSFFLKLWTKIFVFNNIRRDMIWMLIGPTVIWYLIFIWINLAIYSTKYLKNWVICQNWLDNNYSKVPYNQISVGLIYLNIILNIFLNWRPCDTFDTKDGYLTTILETIIGTLVLRTGRVE